MHALISDVNFCLFGLGDSSYERFAYAGKLLQRRLAALGANSLSEPVWGDERAPDGLEQSFLPWLKETVDLLVPHLEPMPGAIDIMEYDLPEPIYHLEWVHDLEALSLEDTHRKASEGGKAEIIGSRQEDQDRHAEGVYKPKDWKWARLRTNKRVTKEDWFQDVREIELELEDSDDEG